MLSAARVSQPDSPLDQAVRAISMFRSFEEMRADMQRTGYIPCLRTDRNVCPTPELHAAAVLVIRALQALPLRIYAPLDPEAGGECTLQEGGKPVRFGRARAA